MKKVGLLLVLALCLVGCKSIIYESPEDNFPSDYKSKIYFEVIGTGECDFAYLGCGEGESVSESSLMSAKTYDKLAAYKQAIGGDANVALASSNSQIIHEKTVFIPWLWESVKSTYKIWGYKVRIKSVTPLKGSKVQLKPDKRAEVSAAPGGLFSFLPGGKK